MGGGGVPGIWTIDFACGHTEKRDLTSKRVDQRAGYARWLAKYDCMECYKKKKNASTFHAKQRAQELEAAERVEQRSGFEPLDGSEKQQAWARHLRADITEGLYDLYVSSGEHDEAWFETTVLEPSRRIARAKWWIENREYDLPAYVELIAAGAQGEDANEPVRS
jgi:hypothetical protein